VGQFSVYATRGFKSVPLWCILTEVKITLSEAIFLLLLRRPCEKIKISPKFIFLPRLSSIGSACPVRFSVDLMQYQETNK
jgi:hypothetical protein